MTSLFGYNAISGMPYSGFLRLREIRENLEKTFYSGKTWKTQGKIWILPDLMEILVCTQGKLRGFFSQHCRNPGIVVSIP